MSPEAFARALPGLVALAGIGRVALALFPPGHPGSHAGADLAATWAASHVLGLAVLGAQAALASLFALPLTPAGLLAPWLAVALVRWALRPAAMVARREPRSERAGPWTAAARLALACALGLPLTRFVQVMDASAELDVLQSGMLLAGAGLVARLGGASAAQGFAALSFASFAALAVLLLHGLAKARRAPLGRTAVVLVLAATPALQLAASGSREVFLALFFGVGAALAIPWLRRADRRAGALAAVAFAACAACDGVGWPLALAGLLALIAFTYRVERAFVAGWSAGALALLALPVFAPSARGGLSEPAFEEVPAAGESAWIACARELADFDRWGILWIASAAVLALALAGVRGGVRRRASEVATGGVDEPGRELAALGLLAALGIAAIAAWVVLAPAAGGDACSGGLGALAPLAALAAGLVLVRSERPT